MTEQPTTEADLGDEDVPSNGTAAWATFMNLQEMEEASRSLTPLPWAVHPDPDRAGLFYVSGPPETEIIAEGLTEENARNLVFFVNAIPEALEQFEDLAKLWDALADGIPTGTDEVSPYLDTIGKYQMEIAQLAANPAPIPEVTKASELSFMHVGHTLVLDGLEMTEVNYSPITSISTVGDFVKVTLGESSTTTLLLPQDAPVKVAVMGPILNYMPEAFSDPNEDPKSSPAEG